MTQSVGISLLLALLLAPNADARRIIGGNDSAEEKPKTKAAPEKSEEEIAAEQAAKAAKLKKKREAKRKKAEEAERKRELAEEAADRAKAEAQARKEAAAEKKAADKKAKEQARLDKNREGRLKNARNSRYLTREEGDIRIVTTMNPGKIEANKVVEIRFYVAKKLEVPHPKYGNNLPQKKLKMVAIVDDGKSKTRYIVHPLKAAGAYGFHHTPIADGEIRVRLEDDKFQNDVNLNVGVWPPPDFENEEANNAKLSASSSARKVIK